MQICKAPTLQLQAHTHASMALACSYLSTLPQLLVRVYDELMQPLPPALAAFGSPGTTPSVAPGPLSVSSQHSVGPGSAPPGSNQSNNSQRMR